MPEKFDFSKPEDQQRFGEKTPEQRNAEVEAAHTEAIDINEEITPLVDRLTLKAKLAELIGDTDVANKNWQELRNKVAETITRIDDRTKKVVESIIAGLDKHIPGEGSDLGVGTLRESDMNSIARVLREKVCLIQRENELYQENAIRIGKMGEGIVIINHLGKLFLMTEEIWATAIEKAKQSPAV